MYLSSSGTYRPCMAAPVYNSPNFTRLVSRVKTGHPSDPAYAHGNPDGWNAKHGPFLHLSQVGIPTARGARRTWGVDQPPCVAQRRQGGNCGAGPRSDRTGGAVSRQIDRRRPGTPRGRVVLCVAYKRVEVPCDDPVSRHDPPSRVFRRPATNPMVSYTQHIACTWPCPAMAARAAFHAVVAFPDLVAYLAVRFHRPENGPCFAFHPSGFPCAYAGSDGFPVLTRKTSPVNLCGLYTGAAIRGR